MLQDRDLGAVSIGKLHFRKEDDPSKRHYCVDPIIDPKRMPQAPIGE